MPTAFTRLDRTGQLNCTREQQQFLGERGLARVRVRNDCKGAAARDFARNIFTRCRVPRARSFGFRKNQWRGSSQAVKKSVRV